MATAPCHRLPFFVVALLVMPSSAWLDFFAAENATAPEPSIQTVPLQKQYVAVEKNGKKIAYKTAYFGEIHTGTPAQTFTVVFDTGSGHIILPQIACRTETCVKHRRYEKAKSSTAVEIEHNGTPIKAGASERDLIVVAFGTGKVTGEFVKEKVCVGASSPACANLRVVAATDMTPDPFSYFAFDGVMGLGLDSIRLHPEFGFFGEVVRQNPGMHHQFSVFLSRHEDGQSTITFGGHDKERATTELDWAPVAMPELGYWQVQIKQIRIGDTILEDCAAGDCRAIVDTGTSLLGVPKLAARNLHRLLARTAPTDVDTNEIDCRKVPGHSIEFDLGDFVMSVPAEDYSRPAPINMTGANNGTSLVCRSLLLPIDMKAPLGPKIFIWGEPVLRRYLTVYDLAKSRIGFSLARQPAPPAAGLESSATIGAPQEGTLLAGAPLPGATLPRAQEAKPEPQLATESKPEQRQPSWLSRFLAHAATIV